MLYYICSYIYKFGDKLRFPLHAEKLEKIRTWIKYYLESQSRIDKEGKFCGFVWFVIPKLIINIKRRAIIEAGKVKKKTGKKNEGVEESENES